MLMLIQQLWDGPYQMKSPMNLKFPPKYAIQKPNQIASAFHSFSTIISYT